jgi:hypothetical protein
MTSKQIDGSIARRGMPNGLLEALDRLAHALRHRPASDILAGDRGIPASDWKPWWIER